MKKKNGLFEKKIDLKNSKINGGRMAASTFSSCTAFSGGSGCSDSSTTVRDDNGNVTSQSTNSW